MRGLPIGLRHLTALGENYMRFSTIASLSLLSACAATPKPCPPALPKIETIEVVRTVAKPCAVTKPAIPAPLARPLPVGSDALIAVLVEKLAQWSGEGGYGERASAAIDECKAAQ